MNFNRLHESSSSRSIIDAVAEEEAIPSNDDNGDANNGSVKRVALQKRYYSMERSKRKFKHSKIVPKDDVDDHDEEEKENEKLLIKEAITPWKEAGTRNAKLSIAK